MRKYCLGWSRRKASQVRFAAHQPSAVHAERRRWLVSPEALRSPRRIADQQTALGSLTMCTRWKSRPSRCRNKNGAQAASHEVLEESVISVYRFENCSSSAKERSAWPQPFCAALACGARKCQTGHLLRFAATGAVALRVRARAGPRWQPRRKRRLRRSPLRGIPAACCRYAHSHRYRQSWSLTDRN